MIVAGTTMNYFLDDKINKAEILFPGVGCFLVAVCLGSCVHASNASDDKAKLRHFANSKSDASRYYFCPIYFKLFRNYYVFFHTESTQQ